MPLFKSLAIAAALTLALPVMPSVLGGADMAQAKNHKKKKKAQVAGFLQVQKCSPNREKIDNLGNFGGARIACVSPQQFFREQESRI